MKVINCIVFLLLFFNSKGQKPSGSPLTFNSHQIMRVFLDSNGKFENTQCWEDEKDIIVLDIFNKTIEIKGTEFTDKFENVKKIRATKSPPEWTMIELSGVHNKYGSCGIRLLLQDQEANLFKQPSFLYIDYKDMTYVYKMIVYKSN